jgi:hypothetical protein
VYSRQAPIIFAMSIPLSVGLSVCPAVLLSLFINAGDPSRILVKFCTGTFRKIWGWTPNLVNIRPQYLVIYMKTHAYSYIVFYRMRKLGSGLSNVRWCKSWKTLISFVMPVCPHVRPSVHIKHHCSHWTNFREIWYWRLSWKSFKKM